MRVIIHALGELKEVFRAYCVSIGLMGLDANAEVPNKLSFSSGKSLERVCAARPRKKFKHVYLSPQGKYERGFGWARGTGTRSLSVSTQQSHSSAIAHRRGCHDARTSVSTLCQLPNTMSGAIRRRVDA